MELTFSRTLDNVHCTSEFLGFGVSDGVLITDTTLKQYSFNAPIHEFPVSSLDMIVHNQENQPEPVVSILSGSIDKSVVHHTIRK
jgi:copper(I)-binding protein